METIYLLQFRSCNCSVSYNGYRNLLYAFTKLEDAEQSKKLLAADYGINEEFIDVVTTPIATTPLSINPNWVH